MNLRGHGTVPVSAPLWLLTIRGIPDHLNALVQRLGFRESEKHPRLWWMRFDPLKTDAHDQAEAIRAELRSAGIAGQWRQVTRSKKPYAPRHNGNVVDFSKHNSTPGAYRRKPARRK